MRYSLQRVNRPVALFSMTMLCTLLLGTLVRPAAAQEGRTGVDVQAAHGQVAVDVDTARGQPSVRHEVLCRVSEIRSMTVENKSNQQVGALEDTIIDVNTGRVLYAIVAFDQAGNSSNRGSQLVAIPWVALMARQATNRNQPALVLNIEPTVLQGTPAFERDDWPDFSNPQYRRELHQYYVDHTTVFQRGRGNARSGRTAGIHINAGPVSVNVASPVSVNVDVNHRQSRAQSAESPQAGPAESDVVCRGSRLIGMAVDTTQGKKRGTVDDLIFNARRGHLRYAVLSYGGRFGKDSQLYAVPWQAFESRQQTGHEQNALLLTVNDLTLKAAPSFDRDQWPDFAMPEAAPRHRPILSTGAAP